MPVSVLPASPVPAVSPDPQRRSRRPVAVAAGTGALLVALAGTTAAFAVDTTTVQLTVDGATARVATHGDTVADVLVAARVKVGEHDLISPSPGSRVSDSDRVAVRHAKPLELVVDGVARTVWVTADDVDGALSEAGVSDAAFVSASRSRDLGFDGMSLDVRLPKQVALAVDGVTSLRTSTAATVGEALTEAGIVLGPADQVTPTADAALAEGLQIAVTRVTTTDVGVPFGTERRADPTLAQGETRELQAGADGVNRQVWAANTVGNVQTPTLVSTAPVAAPRSRVVAYGTKPQPQPQPQPRPVAAPASAASGGGLNWGALAACESGGNPGAVSASGIYYGLYQFSVSTWRGLGGSGLPSEASAAEQTARAQALYGRSGTSPWPLCGRYL